MIKKNNTYKFLNIIDKEKLVNYTQDEKKQYLLDKKLYILNELGLKKLAENQGVVEGYPYDNFFTYHDVSDEVIRDMAAYIEEAKNNLTARLDEIKIDIIARLDRAIDNSYKEKILKKEYENYSDQLNLSDMPKRSLSLKNDSDFTFNCLKLLKLDKYDTIGYLTEKSPHIRSYTSAMLRCPEIKLDFEILEFLKEEMNKIKGSNKEKVNKPKSKIPLPFNDEIFRTIEAQNWFFDTLNKMGALEKDKKPKKRKFQPICHAIFNLSDSKKLIFKYNLAHKDYILFLNEEFKANIKTKLSDGYLHEAVVEEALSNFI